MLASVLRTLVNNLFKKSFDVTFMENKKSCYNIKCFFILFQLKLYLNKLLIIL